MVRLAMVLAALVIQSPAHADDVRSAPVDLRGILVEGSLDLDMAAQAGLDVSEMKPPRPKKQVAPVYPDSSLRSGRIVEVVTECRLDTRGVPRDCRVTKSGDSFLSEATLQAIRQWRYEPLRVRDVPKDALIAITMQFDPKPR